MTKVIFYLENGNIPFAFFPEMVHNGDVMSCYAHLGQHSACSKEYLKGKKLASPLQYYPLLKELEGQGYDDLQVLDKRKTLSRILDEVSCKYGAPMGRIGVGEKPAKGKIFDSPVRLEDGGYDKGGAYWGTPNNLRVEYTKDMSYIHFYRTK